MLSTTFAGGGQKKLKAYAGRDRSKYRCNGAALHLDQGIAVTSHASQAKTVDQVIASVPVRAFSQANEAQFYVSMSRARWAMHVFTDSKVALRDAVTRPSKRASVRLLLKNSGKLEVAQQIANHESLRTTKLYDRHQDEISLDEIERITI